MKKLANNIFNIPKYLLISIIDIYQSILSPDHSWLKARFPMATAVFTLPAVSMPKNQ